MQNSQTFPKSFGWVHGQLVLTEQHHLIVRCNNTPHVIPVDISEELTTHILSSGFPLTTEWKVYPETYPVNGIVSKFSITELPKPQKKSKNKEFFLVGTLNFISDNKFRLTIKDQKRIMMYGSLPTRFRLGDEIYIHANLVERQLHLINCCSTLDYLVQKKKHIPFSFTLNDYPQLINYGQVQGSLKQFWTSYGSESIAVILKPQNIEEIDILKSGQYIAQVSGSLENINGVTTITKPEIKTEVKLYDGEDDLFATQIEKDTPRARILGTELAYR